MVQVFGNLITLVIFMFFAAIILGGIMIGLAIILSIVGWIVEQVHRMTR